MAQPAAASSSASGRRRGHRKIASWGVVFCFGGTRRERGEQALAAEGTPRWRKQRQRTVPVDGDPPVLADRDVMRRGASDKASRKGLCLQGCCFLAPARAPQRKHSTSTMDDSGNGAHDKQRQLLEHTKPRPPRSPSEPPAPSASQMQATDGSSCRRAEQPRGGGAPAETRGSAKLSDSEASSKREAPARGRACPPKAKASSGGGVGAFGPVVGLSVVAAVSMAGLLGGRLWAVACVCAWLAAMSKLPRRAAGSVGGGEEAVADVDSTDYKKLVVLRGLLERDHRTKAVKE